ncbi:hypothetical protein ACHAW5_001825 [Stephanodiscus triporus]|uniref:BZIP domain-containing protein n=1 Tax=Stephanodiscus triporus TaxID=2934178 RepID=A0ABD3MQW8_9STRA
MLRGTSITLESDNPCRRGRTRSDHRRKKSDDVVDRIGQNEKMLRMKFEIEGLYEEIYELKRENEELWRIWERVRRTSPARGSGGGDVMHLKRAPPVAHFGGQVPCMVQVSDAIDNIGHASDLECNSDRDCE